MKTVEGKLTAVIQARAEQLAHLAIMSLSDNGYPPGNFNITNEIIASKRKSQKASGIGYDLDYTTRLSWKSDGAEKTKLTVQVREREGHLTVKECQQECYKLIKGINDRAEVSAARIATKAHRTTYGDARWATESDLHDAGYITDGIDSNQLLLGPYNPSTANPTPRYITLTSEETQRHTLVCGPTGCGKTSTLFVPNLLERTNCSAIVSEATAGTVETSNPEEIPTNGPDLMQKTAGYRASMGHKIYYFNPDDLSSHRINPLQGITTIRQSTRLANLLIKNTNVRLDTTSDPFWETAETALLCSLIMHEAGNLGNLGRVRRLLREGPRVLAQLLENSNVPEARARYSEFLEWSTENTRNSIVIGLMQRLELWTQPTIVALTETTDIDFDKLQDELFTFYLAVPADKPELKPCASIIFTFLLDFVISKPIKHTPLLFLDEFTNFGLIPDFPNKLSIVRHRGISTMLGLQDYNQAEEIYKSTATMLFSQPATRIFFKPQTLAQAKIISESLGVENIYEPTVSSSCQINEKEFGRDLMTPAAVQMLTKGHAIVFTPGTPPIDLVRFNPGDYNDKSKIPPPPRRLLKVNDNLVQQCSDAQPPNPMNFGTLIQPPTQTPFPTQHQPQPPTPTASTATASTTPSQPYTAPASATPSNSPPPAATTHDEREKNNTTRPETPIFNERGDRIPRY